MREVLESIMAGQSLTREEAALALRRIASGEIAPAQIAAFLTAFRMRPVTTAELSGFRKTMLELATPLKTESEVIDICGTGGDGKDTFNISTSAAFIVAASGVKVAKHGNYGISSLCGSSNVLEALGVPFAKNESHANQQLRKCNITFLHAPHWHPAMKVVAPIRKELGFKTIFNMLGPIVNPAQPKNQIIGVHTPALQKLYTEVLSSDTCNFAVLHAVDGYDEISLTGTAEVASKSKISSLTPEDFGASRLRPADLSGGASIKDFAACLLEILHGRGTDAQNSVVAANAAVAIALVRSSTDYKSLYAESLDTIRSGAAAKVLTDLRETA